MLDRLSTVAFGKLPEEAQSIADTIGRRRDEFWYEEGYVGYWDLLTHGLSVVRSAAEAITELESETHTSQDLARNYTEDWWNIDAEYRHYVRSTMEFRRYVEGLDEVRDRITNYYMRFLKALNRPLADALVKDPEIGAPQTQFLDEYTIDDQGTAVIVCDGLRYELAKELEEEIEDDDEMELSLSHASAALPSITEVGMAAHLPGELSLNLRNGNLLVEVEGREMNTKSDRVDRLESAGFTVADLSTILATKKRDLEEEGTPPRIVYSDIIDKLGENLDDDNALVETAEHVRDIDDVIQRLRAVGYTRFVVTADHGFLYTKRLPEELKVEALSGVEITKRRFALAEAGDVVDAGDEVVEFSSDHFDTLGIDAQSLRAFFSRSVACFKAAGGKMRYFHGGLSMQELAVPCLTIATEAFEEEASVEYEVSFPENVTNTIVDVEISARSSQISFDRAPTLRLTATVDGREVAEPKLVEINQGGNEETLRLKSGELEEDGIVLFEAIDEETRETIARQESGIDMLIRDDFGFDV
jgi:hypothetical protein